MEYKRLNIRIPMPLYNRIKEYCDSVGSPVGSGMCLLCDAQINAMKASEILAMGHDLIQNVSSLEDTVKANQIDQK